MALCVLVVDDTVIYRKIMIDALEDLPGVATTGKAPSGVLALRKLAQQSYDLVLLDVEMPEMDGIETLKHIRHDFPEVAVVMVTAVTEKGSETAIQALNLGAIDLIRKPQGKDARDSVRQLRGELAGVMNVVETHRRTGMLASARDRKVVGGDTVTAPRPLSRPRPMPVASSALPANFGLLAIGSSTGGPEALSRVIPLLPDNFPLPVVIVQHMPPVFTEALARDLDRKSHLHVKEAAEGDSVEPGTVLVAPGGAHMIVERGAAGRVVGIDHGPPENSCRPAVDVLFRSIAQLADRRAVLSVIMTGMGSDGSHGVELLKQHKCYCLTQSAPTCVVYGMPQAVDAAGLSDESIDLGQIAERIGELVGGRRM